MDSEPPAPPPYVIDFVQIDLPEMSETDLEETFIDAPRAEFVHGARAAALAVPASFPPAGVDANTLSISVEGRECRLSRDGFIQVPESERVSLLQFCLDSYSVFGWEELRLVQDQLRSLADAELRQQMSTERSALATDLLFALEALQSELARRIADFLASFEQSLLTELDAALEETARVIQESRSLYLDPEAKPGAPRLRRGKDGTVAAEPAKLRDDVKVLLDVLQALADHNLLFLPLTTTGAAAKAFQTPLLLTSVLPAADSGDATKLLGPILGPELVAWYQERISDYVKGRNALLRAMSQYLASARQRHPLIERLWYRFSKQPTDEELAREIANLLAEAKASIERAQDMRGRGDFSALYREMPRSSATPASGAGGGGEGHGGPEEGGTEGGDAVSPIPDRAAILEVGDFASQDRPEEWLGELLSRRGMMAGRRDPLVGALPEVTVWDLDQLVANTRNALCAQGRLGPVEASASRILDNKMGWTDLGDYALDLGGTLAIGAIPVVGPAVLALVGVLNAIYEYRKFSALKVLYDAETLTALKGARRIVAREPSAGELLAALIGLVGDAAGARGLHKLTQVLFADQVLLGVLLALDEPKPDRAVDNDIVDLLGVYLQKTSEEPSSSAP